MIFKDNPSDSKIFDSNLGIESPLKAIFKVIWKLTSDFEEIPSDLKKSKVTWGNPKWLGRIISDFQDIQSDLKTFDINKLSDYNWK